MCGVDSAAYVHVYVLHMLQHAAEILVTTYLRVISLFVPGETLPVDWSDKYVLTLWVSGGGGSSNVEFPETVSANLSW